MTQVTYLQSFDTGKTIVRVGDEVENGDVRFFIGSINDSGDLCFIDKAKPWSVKNKTHPMARCMEQGNYGVSVRQIKVIKGEQA
ncbi:hypothetical protein UFOVP189_34 [uncultured Caudovirales phage]|uniref:Uncharacterized protein n=1 Tax=uncultured Caudovirales phage TaxID=2100421 RepID=A0A6J7WIL7_9CAUD|nr:hypothetical protein UFOVP189_34 [uncultured Caudovirales phage]